MLGKEAALFVASGTMGNLASLLAHCGRGDEVILGDESHIFWFESGGAAALGGMPFSLIPTSRFGELDLDLVEQRIRPQPRLGYPRTGVIAIENTQNRCSGVALSLDYLQSLRSVADRHGVPVHMDGARIFNAAAASDVPVEEIARNADSVQFCLSKGLGAPVGSIVVGTREFIERARAARKILGGAMRQSGVIAAAGIVALTEMVERLPEDHRRARSLAEGLHDIPGVSVDLETTQSNIVIFQTEPAVPHLDFVQRMRDNGILISNYGARGLRMVTHHHISDEDIQAALRSVATIMSAEPAVAD
jgi:threonine aldolase